MQYVTTALGGIGLFLLGMWLITEGLRLAAGQSLERLLARWTSSRGRGLLSGTLLTALLQSSSAVTVAAIGFVNAGLIGFQRAVWVIFGSNVGTALTAWIVALIGFKFKIDALALPIIGVGALLRMFAPSERYRSFGMALAGFGVLFMGIDVLAGGFGELGARMDVDATYSLPMMVLLGVILTTLMQSSSAAMAIVLTAVASGVIGLTEAAAVVIGANVGTTSTALLATLGATANARRLAAAHVCFNLLTGIAALILLWPLVALVVQLGEWLEIDNDLVLLLALFHTIFNVLGILLMWPLEPYMSRQLLLRFADAPTPAPSAVPTVAALQFLDRNVASVPDAVSIALCRELQPILQALPSAITRLAQDHDSVAASQQRLQHLSAIGDFFVTASSLPTRDEVSESLARIWRVQHNLVYVEETLQRLVVLWQQLEQQPTASLAQPPLQDWLDATAVYLQALPTTAQTEQADFEVLLSGYHAVKQQLLQAALQGQISRHALDTSLQLCSLSRYLIEQWLRAFNHHRQLLYTLTPLQAASVPVIAAEKPLKN